jgi:hypothetical protein
MHSIRAFCILESKLAFNFRNSFSVFVSLNGEPQLAPKAFRFMSLVLIKLDRDMSCLDVVLLQK